MPATMPTSRPLARVAGLLLGGILLAGSPLRAQGVLPPSAGAAHLEALRRGPAAARWRAVDWLARHGAGERARRALLDLARRADEPALRTRALRAAAAWTPPAEAPALAVRWIGEPSAAAVMVRLLGVTPSAEARVVLLGTATCRGELRAACVQALAGHGPRAVPHLVQVLLADDGAPTARRLAAEALGAMGSPAALPALRAVAERGQPEEVRHAAARAAQRLLGDAESGSDGSSGRWRPVAAADGPPSLDALPACEVWLERAGRCPVEPLPPLPPHTDPAARADRLALAAACLGRWPRETASRWRRRLLQAAHASPPLVRAVAMWGIGRARVAAGRGLLRAALDDDSPMVRLAAARALGPWGPGWQADRWLRARQVLERVGFVRPALEDLRRGEGPWPGPLPKRPVWVARDLRAPSPDAWLQVQWSDGRAAWVAPRCLPPHGVPVAGAEGARLRWRWRPHAEGTMRRAGRCPPPEASGRAILGACQ